MAKNHVEDVSKQVWGSIKEAVGKVTGNIELEAEGTAEKAASEPHPVSSSAEKMRWCR